MKKSVSYVIEQRTFSFDWISIVLDALPNKFPEAFIELFDWNNNQGFEYEFIRQVLGSTEISNKLRYPVGNVAGSLIKGLAFNLISFDWEFGIILPDHSRIEFRDSILYFEGLDDDYIKLITEVALVHDWVARA